ncbi:unnamed protein product [Mytilus edulis]|uniref:IPT/TIG domain-containing protein n=1 Tax=Mytilus edulis TaxID=6550 RepID=A0A8S3UJR9_MYTED|nr:unnamed protein product [Mytilus edulis]
MRFDKQVFPTSGPVNGGTLLTISGNYLGNVNDSISVNIGGVKCNIVTIQTPYTKNKPCDVPEDTSTECETPPRLENQPNNQTIEVYFDGLTIHFTIEYVDDPTFDPFPDIFQYDKESSIGIKGRNILTVARREDYHINIGLDGICLITDISMYNITCLPPKSVPRTNKTDDNTVHVIVNVIKIKVYIGDLQYKTEIITEDGNTFVMVVGILAAGVVVSISIGMSAVIVLRRKKTKAGNEFKMEIKAKEEMIQQARREGLSERLENLRGEDRDPYTEPDESVYDEIHSDEENANDGYDELGQRSPKNPYNQLQQKRADNPNQDEINADEQTNEHSDYLNVCDGYEKQISRNDPLYINQLQQELKTKNPDKS